MWLLRPVMAFALVASLAGCESIIAGSGPMKESIVDTPPTEETPGYRLIDVTAREVLNYLVEPVIDRSGSAIGARTQASVRLSPGDTVKVVIAENAPNGLFANLANGGTVFNNVLVSGSGSISLPYAGTVHVAGAEPAQVEQRIRKKLTGMSVDPQVYVELISNRNHSILVSGEVKQPLRVSMLDGPMTLVDAVARAGGLTQSPMQVDAVIRGRNGTRRVPMAQAYAGANVELRPGDVVSLTVMDRKFNAMGAVKSPGQQELRNFNQSVLDALSQVGGLNDVQANPTGVFLFRQHPTHAWRDETGRWIGGWVVFRFDLRRPETIFLAQKFGMKPGDTIYVTNAPATEWMKIIQPLAATIVAVRTGASLSTVYGN